MSTPLLQYTLLFECHADYFECHEVLEEAWQDGGRQDLGYAVLIQYAVAHYHARRGNMAGAKRASRRSSRSSGWPRPSSRGTASTWRRSPET
ncbi:DUF309 domain-containing protein [Exiguobacterium mexicanum]|uniref:DUF309 domain-containing protein n=1 Tax=Exiguobacterium mexicanum TaxID=340146 RepID=UPI0037BF0557